VRLAAASVSVRRALQRQPGGGLVLVPPKSWAGQRTIVLPEPLVAQLREHGAPRTAARGLEGAVAGPGPGVRHRAGQAHRPRNDHRAWRTLLADSGVRPARLHDARHIAAALLLAQGVPPRVAMQALGHSQIGLTLGTYSHVVPELSQEAAAAMTRALWIAPQVVEQPAEETSDETLAATLAASPPKPTGVTPPMSLLTCEDAVGRPGIEPGTRGLKVRCSAS